MLNSKINFRRMTEARYEHGLSVSELSIITGLTEKQIMELESGKNEKQRKQSLIVGLMPNDVKNNYA